MYDSCRLVDRTVPSVSFPVGPARPQHTVPPASRVSRTWVKIKHKIHESASVCYHVSDSKCSHITPHTSRCAFTRLRMRDVCSGTVKFLLQETLRRARLCPSLVYQTGCQSAHLLHTYTHSGNGIACGCKSRHLAAGKHITTAYTPDITGRHHTVTTTFMFAFHTGYSMVH